MDNRGNCVGRIRSHIKWSLGLGDVDMGEKEEQPHAFALGDGYSHTRSTSEGLVREQRTEL